MLSVEFSMTAGQPAEYAAHGIADGNLHTKPTSFQCGLLQPEIHSQTGMFQVLQGFYMPDWNTDNQPYLTSVPESGGVRVLEWEPQQISRVVDICSILYFGGFVKINFKVN